MHGFGLERLGLAALRSPRLALGLVALITVLAIVGATRLSFNSNIRDMFRSDSESYAAYVEMTRHYPSSENDLYLVVEGKELFTPANLERLRDLYLDVALIDGLKGVLSIFSARSPPDGNGKMAEIFPQDIDETLDLDALGRTLAAHPLTKRKLIADDRQLMVIMIALADEATQLTHVRRILADIRESAALALEGSDLRIGITGMPAIRATIVGMLTRDQLVFKVAAFSISLLLSWLYFRSWRFLVLAIAPPGISAIWLLGGMGWVGQDITVVTNVVPNLVMVITFANAVHLLVAIRRLARLGGDGKDVIAGAVRAVGPATVLTAGTTAIALMSLLVVGRPVISSFALTAAYGTVLAFIAVLTVVPALGSFLLRFDQADARGDASRGMESAIGRSARTIADLVAAWPRTIAAAGIIAFVLCAIAYFLNEPQFRYGANLPQKSEVARTAHTIDERLAGTSTIRLMLSFPKGQDPVSESSLKIVGEAHTILAASDTLKEVWSMHSVAQWLGRSGAQREEVLEFLGKTQSTWTGRLYSRKSGTALITAQMPDMEASQLLPMMDIIQERLEILRLRHQGFSFTLTGTAAFSARAAYDMIWALSRSLLIAIAVIIVLIGLSMRSLSGSMLSILPNLLPIAAAGAYLYLSGQQMQFTSIIIFTIGFGIAVDSTIHMLNHYRRAMSNGGDPALQLRATIVAIGPALILSTLALMAGGVTMLSPLPMAQLYGQLILIVLFFALIGDILLLPALIAAAQRMKILVR
jgi:predicted RND superfamily exporter protein